MEARYLLSGKQLVALTNGDVNRRELYKTIIGHQFVGNSDTEMHSDVIRSKSLFLSENGADDNDTRKNLSEEDMWELIRGFGYTTSGQTSELVDAIITAERNKK